MSPTKNEVLKNLPVFKNEIKLVTWQQSTKRIATEILHTHELYQADYDNVYQLFDTGDIYTTCEGLWNFCKYNLKYTIEGEEEQSVKSPAAILTPGQKIDCKHYALFIGGILDAMRYNEGDCWDLFYRFASYSDSKQIEHVFVVVKDGNKEIWVDPVLTSFNQRKKPTYYMDRQIGALYSISGIGNDKPVTINVDKQMAMNDFLKLVNLNCFSLKTMLKDNMDITNGPVKDYFMQHGFDFNRLLRMIQA